MIFTVLLLLFQYLTASIQQGKRLVQGYAGIVNDVHHWSLQDGQGDTRGGSGL